MAYRFRSEYSLLCACPKRAAAWLSILCLLFLSVSSISCSPDDEEDDAGAVDAVAIDLVVEQDDFLGFLKGTVIGDLWFSDSVGLVGTPLEIVVRINQFGRFSGVELTCTIVLADADLTKIDEFTAEFSVDEKRVEYDIIVPQVKTIPAVLNYEVTLSAVNPSDAGEIFEARLDYQFLVNQGTPAT